MAIICLWLVGCALCGERQSPRKIRNVECPKDDQQKYEHCEVCTESGGAYTCAKCKAGYIADDQGACQLDPGTSDACPTSSENNKYQYCTKCNKKSDTDYECTECREGHTDFSKFCGECANGYIKDDQGACQLDPGTSDACPTSSENNKYQYCTKCNKKSDTDYECTECREGHTDFSKFCGECANGYIKDDQGACQLDPGTSDACPTSSENNKYQYCTKCNKKSDTDYECTECREGHTDFSKFCGECANGYIKDDQGACKPDPGTSDACPTSSENNKYQYCTKCNKKSDTDYECTECREGHTDFSKFCGECASGYIKDDQGACKPDPGTSDACPTSSENNKYQYCTKCNKKSDTDYECTECREGHTDFSKFCGECASGYIKDDQGACKPDPGTSDACPTSSENNKYQYCTKCNKKSDTDYECTECREGHTDFSKFCGECANGYIKDDQGACQLDPGTSDACPTSSENNKYQYCTKCNKKSDTDYECTECREGHTDFSKFCGECASGYIKDDQGACKPDPGTSDACPTSSENNKYQYCTKCNKKSDTDYECTECREGHADFSKFCGECASGYIKDDQGACKPDPGTSDACPTSSENNKYQYCTKCNKKSDTDYECTECREGHTDFSKFCGECANGYIKDDQGACQLDPGTSDACPTSSENNKYQYCTKCNKKSDTDYECTECREGHTDFSKFCGECASGYIKDDQGACKPDPGTSDACPTSSENNKYQYCTKCNKKSDTDYECTECREGHTDFSKFCGECANGYIKDDQGACQLDPGTSDACPTSSENNKYQYCTKCNKKSDTDYECTECREGHTDFSKFCGECANGYIKDDQGACQLDPGTSDACPTSSENNKYQYCTKCNKKSDTDYECTECREGHTDFSKFCGECANGYIKDEQGACQYLPITSFESPLETLIDVSSSFSIIFSSAESSHQTPSSIPIQTPSETPKEPVEELTPNIPSKTLEISNLNESNTNVAVSIPQDFNHTIEYKSDVGENTTVDFKDEFSSNVYLYPLGDQPEITLKSSNGDNEVYAGVEIPNKITKININSPTINLNLKGSGEVTFNAGDNVNQVNIRNATLDKESLTIDSAKNVEINQLSLYRTAKFDSKDNTNVKIHTLKVQQKSTPVLSNCDIVKEILISLDSSLTLDKNVDISQTTLTIYYQDTMNNQKPALTMRDTLKTTNPPNKIRFDEGILNAYLEEPESTENNVERTLTVVSGIINCKDWEEKVDLTSSNYSSTKCEKIPESDLYKLVVSSKPPSKSKLQPGAIAGIVIACVVVVAVIAGVSIYISKKKNLQSLGIESSINEESDSIAI